MIEKIRIFFKENLTVIRDDFKEIIVTTDNGLLKNCLNLSTVMLEQCRESVTFEKLT